MSFEIYVQAYSKGKQFGLPLKEVFKLFGDHVSKTSPALWKVYYTVQNNCEIHVGISDSNESEISNFTIHRPCSDIRLWTSLFAIMGLGHVVLYFPGSRALLRNKESLIHLPVDMVNALGSNIVSDVQELRNELSVA
jgi:hypothetical protein